MEGAGKKVTHFMVLFRYSQGETEMKPVSNSEEPVSDRK
jgi:hypothetical protein